MITSKQASEIVSGGIQKSKAAMDEAIKDICRKTIRNHEADFTALIDLVTKYVSEYLDTGYANTELEEKIIHESMVTVFGPDIEDVIRQAGDIHSMKREIKKYDPNKR